MQETKAGWGLGNKTDVCRCLGQLALLSFSCIHLVFSCCGLVTIVLTVNQCNIQTKDDYSLVPRPPRPAFVACSFVLQATKAGRGTASNKSWAWRPGNEAKMIILQNTQSHISMCMAWFLAQLENIQTKDDNSPTVPAIVLGGTLAHYPWENVNGVFVLKCLVVGLHFDLW